MALVNRPTAELKFNLRDASGSLGSFIVHVPYATLAAVAIAAADALVTAVAAITDCVVLGYTLSYTSVEDAPGAPVTGSRVEEKGTFIWNTSNGRKSQFNIPAIKDSLLNTSGSVNQSNALIIALVAAVTAGDLVFASADGSDLTSLDRAYQSFRTSTKRQLPSDR